MSKIVSAIAALFFSFSLFCKPLLCHAEHKKEILFLDSDNSAGMFAAFYMILGALEYAHENKLSGVKVNFGEQGLYFDPSKGGNWWEYYFEPLPIYHNKGNHCHLKKISPKGKVKLVTEGTRLSKGRAHHLIEKYIRVKPYIQDKVNRFVEEHFKDYYIVGVHYRGTDKSSEAPRVSYEKVSDEVCQQLIIRRAYNYKIYVATDELAFLDFMIDRFGRDVIYIDAIRSSDLTPVHLSKTSPWRAGEDALLDCLLLSRTHLLIRTSSNLSSVSYKINPSLPVISLSRARVY